MQTIYELVTLDVRNEHDLEHDLEHKTKFSTPKIFDAKGDLSKRWYVYFSYREPKSGKLKRMRNIYGKANRFKTKAERYSALNLYKKRLLKFLNDGYNPFEDNTQLYQSALDNENKRVGYHNKTEINSDRNLLKLEPNDKSVKIAQSESNEKSIAISDAFQQALDLKTNVVNKRTLTDYKSRISQLERWLKLNYPNHTFINQIGKREISEFLNVIQLKTSARNRNNYRTVFSSIFQLLEDNDIIDRNFVMHIKALRTRPKRNKTYSRYEQEEIFEYLEQNDALLLLYIKFISYNLLRPIEVCRLKIMDINHEQKTLSFQAKNKVLKTKIIPELLLKELPDLSDKNAELLLFTPNEVGGEWDTTLTNRRDYFSKRFKTVIKDHFGYNENYGLYSFRHTFITKLYRALAKDSSPYEAKSKLMQITGHTTMQALEKYLRDIDAELPEDYSNLL